MPDLMIWKQILLSHDKDAIKMSYNRCKDTHKFGNKYLPLAYKTQVDFRSHYSGNVCVLLSEKYGSYYFLQMFTCKQWSFILKGPKYHDEVSRGAGIFISIVIIFTNNSVIIRGFLKFGVISYHVNFSFKVNRGEKKLLNLTLMTELYTLMM